RAATGKRRLSVSLLAGAHDPRLLPADARAHPGGGAAAHPGGSRTAAADGALPRPLLHGRRLPVARNQECRPVRPALRHDLVRQRTRLRGDPSRGLPRDRGCEAIDLGPPWRLYAALLVALAVAWLVPPDLLLGLTVVPRFIVAV